LIVTSSVILLFLVFLAVEVNYNPHQLNIPPDQQSTYFIFVITIICTMFVEVCLAIAATALECIERPGRPAQVSRFVIWILLVMFQVPSTFLFAIYFFFVLGVCTNCALILAFVAIPALISLGFLIGTIIACAGARPKKVPDSKVEPLLEQGTAVQIQSSV
jgi:hypothetical protein